MTGLNIRELTNQAYSARNFFSIFWLDVGEEVSGGVCLVGKLSDVQTSHGACFLAEEWSLGDEEKVESREWYQVDTEFSEVTVKFTRESKRASNTASGLCDQTVQLLVGWLVVLEDVVVDVIQGFVVDDESFIRVF